MRISQHLKNAIVASAHKKSLIASDLGFL